MDPKTRLLYLAVLGLNLGAMPAARADAWPMREDLPAPCAQAHAAYLSGDLAAFADAAGIASCLQAADASPTLTQNAVALATAAYAAGGGTLAGDFHLPKELKQLRIVQRRNEDRNGVRYVIEFTGKFAANSHITALKLVRYPDETVLDRQDSRYEFKEDAAGFYLKRSGEIAAPEGLYKVLVQVEGGAPVEAWVPIVDWASDRSPTITAPQLDGGAQPANPVLSWESFSTGDRGYLWRSFYAEIIRSEAPDYGWDKVWGLDGREGAPTRAVVGKEPRGQGVTALVPGRYLFSITYQEPRSFGDLQIVKSSESRVVFRTH